MSCVMIFAPILIKTALSLVWPQINQLKIPPIMSPVKSSKLFLIPWVVWMRTTMQASEGLRLYYCTLQEQNLLLHGEWLQRELNIREQA